MWWWWDGRKGVGYISGFSILLRFNRIHSVWITGASSQLAIEVCSIYVCMSRYILLSLGWPRQLYVHLNISSCLHSTF